MNYGLKGIKTINIRQISAIQLKESKITIGYIQFVIVGSSESKGGLQRAMKDENTVIFDGGIDKNANTKAKEIKKYIEDYINNNNKNANVKIEDKYDKLAKLKKLLDNNVITENEFNEEKNKILNN